MTQHNSYRMRWVIATLLSLLWVPCSTCHILTAQTADPNQLESSPQQEKSADNGRATPELETENQTIHQKLYWVFLSSGKSLQGVASEKVEAMRSGHLENFNRLAEQGSLLSAGSVTDPAESLQGVAIVAADSAQPLDAMFKDDEFVQGGFRKIQATRMRLEHGVITAGKNDRNGMQEFRMVLLENSKPNGTDANQQVLEDSRKYIKSMYTEKDVRLGIRLEKNVQGREIVLVLDKPEKENGFKERLQKIPAVKSGLWKAKIMPVFFGKGTLNQS